MERRIRVLEALHRPPETIAIEYLVDSLPPMSAAVAEQHERFIADVEVNGLPPVVPADPAKGITDDDLAEWVLKTLPHDMVVSADGCAALLLSAYWRRDRDRYGEDYAWRHQRNREQIAKRLQGRFS